ncbi:hypothetical protein Tco_0642374 [Tanacetum coccineum]
MHDDVQPNYVVDSHADYTSNSNMIPYDQYVKDNAVPVVQSNVSSVTNDAYMMIYNDMCEPHAQSVSKTTRNIVVDNSLTAKLETYKEQVELYERRARFELTEREQKIDEQLRIVITDRNIKEENLKKELHSVKLQLASTINHNKSMVEEVTLKARCLELKVELSNLRDKIQKDNHDELIKRFSNLEVNHLNLQLKYQNLKESFGNDTSPPTRDVPDFDSVFVIEKMKASIQGKDNAIKKLRMQISQLNETRSEADRTLDFRTLDFQITQLTKKINVLQEQNELFGAENGR